MTTTRVRAHERRNPHGGTEHVKEHSRRVDDAAATNTDETNFEDQDQEEAEREGQESDR